MRTMFVNPPMRVNAPRPWSALYRQRYGKKRGKRTSKKSKPTGKSKRDSKGRFSKNPNYKSKPKSVTLSVKELKNMLSNRNPRRRRGSRVRARGRRHSRRMRRNAGITPFIQSNPYMYANPRRRHSIRRRRNPGLSIPSLSLNRIVSKTMTYGGGAALGTATNIFALNKISNHYLRNGARVLTACVGAPMLKGELGAAAAGALLSPMVIELAAFLKLPIATDADLEADLQDLLEEIDSTDGGSDNQPTGADLF